MLFKLKNKQWNVRAEEAKWYDRSLDRHVQTERQTETVGRLLKLSNPHKSRTVN